MIDLTGQRYGRLTVICFGSTRWKCLCDCGETTWVRSNSLRSGNTKSCGCFYREIITAGITRTHGHTSGYAQSKSYSCWDSIKQRCYNPKHKYYKDYGGRGIIVCERWRNSFEKFLADMGIAPIGLSLERINNNGNYEPGNCRWATAKEQVDNRRPVRRIEQFTDNEIETEYFRRQQLNDQLARMQPLLLIAAE